MTTSATDRHGARPSLRETVAHEVIAAIAQHRVVDTRQLQALLLPDGSRQHMSEVLTKLRKEHLIDCVTLAGTHRLRAWFLTRRGVRATESWPEVRRRAQYPITGRTVASLTAAHARAVVDTHLAFVRDARRHGDEHGPWDWIPETTHNLTDGELLQADALLHYSAASLEGNRAQLRAFIEVDRATTSSGTLASKLIRYARFYAHTHVPVLGRRSAAAQQTAAPGWQRWYPVFPRVLFVLTNASPVTYQHRIEDLQAMVAEHPLVARMAAKVPLGAAVLSELEERGPRAPVWTPLGGLPEAWRSLEAPAGRCAWTDL
ncbi:replication-relaxation family protein [Streptomyces sp. NA02950]|uniref:replication-relaxation family protein n=1 Tax=Streptomyces sp. NA02950 TaxID=2742137 RepID=UPI001591C618|nr:replication-relaxation family protein [Streptomyces sp. NA02950]QKV90399.1 replication-relaxation family protein [Streptomyces sp. NA02950]QKV97268.1 replication-relaxation family protein [Streptomyces sp. NA02950]